MVKNWDGGGAYGFRLRLEDPLTGQPITRTDGIHVRLAPETMINIPQSAAAVTRTLPEYFVTGEEADISLAITGGPVTLHERVPDTMAIVDAGGGSADGNPLTWDGATDTVTYRVRALEPGGMFFGWAEQPDGVLITVEGPFAAPVATMTNGWYSADIGTTEFAGSAVASGDTLAIDASGRIWNQREDFHFVWKVFGASERPVIEARIDGFDGNLEQLAGAGIMVRTRATPESPCVWLAAFPKAVGDDPLTQTPGFLLARRFATGDYTYWEWPPPSITFPRWLRMFYQDGVVTTSTAPDAGGQPGSWAPYVTERLNLEGSDRFLAGIALMSAWRGAETTAELSGIRITEGTLPITNLTAVPAPGQIDLSWQNGGSYDTMALSAFLVDESYFVRETSQQIPGDTTEWTFNPPQLPTAAFVVVTLVPTANGLAGPVAAGSSPSGCDRSPRPNRSPRSAPLRSPSGAPTPPASAGMPGATARPDTDRRRRRCSKGSWAGRTRPTAPSRSPGRAPRARTCPRVRVAASLHQTQASAPPP